MSAFNYTQHANFKVVESYWSIWNVKAKNLYRNGLPNEETNVISGRIDGRNKLLLRGIVLVEKLFDIYSGTVGIDLKKEVDYSTSLTLASLDTSTLAKGFQAVNSAFLSDMNAPTVKNEKMYFCINFSEPISNKEVGKLKFGFEVLDLGIKRNQGFLLSGSEFEDGDILPLGGYNG